jgi:hypothetical protein
MTEKKPIAARLIVPLISVSHFVNPLLVTEWFIPWRRRHLNDAIKTIVLWYRESERERERTWTVVLHHNWDCIKTNLMHKILTYLSNYFCLTCFGLSFSLSSVVGVQLRQWFKSPGYGVSDRALSPYPGDLNHCRSCTPASEDELKSPKYVRQK